MVAPLGLVDYNWVNSPESKQYLMAMMENNNSTSLKKYGFLDRPVFDKKIKEFSYKIILSGKSGCGKTCTVSKLAGNEVQRLYRETPGIEQTTIFWPCRLIGSKDPVVFKLKFCDAGEGCLSRFNHILPTMKENADGVIFCFSMTDRSSFDDIPQQMSKFLGDHQTGSSGVSNSGSHLSKLVIATKLDQHGKSEVPQRELIDFERQYNIPIIGISNLTPGPSSTGANSGLDSSAAGPIPGLGADLRTTAPILNCLCERLWYRDQQEAGLVI